MGTRTLHLVRHGQYRTKPEEGLTAIGLAQAHCVAARLAEEPGIARITSSASARARETADAVGQALPSASRSWSRMLVECIPTPPRWKIPKKLERHFGTRAAEDWERDQARLERLCREWLRPTRGGERTEVLVFHGNLIRAMVCSALDVPLAAWWDLHIHHCSLTTLLVGKRVRLVRFNDVGHLPRALQTDQ